AGSPVRLSCPSQLSLLWDCPSSRRLGCSSLAIAPVQPVWCEAPTPRPLSPWKVFVEQQVVAEVRIALQLRRRRSYVITSTSVEQPQPISLPALPTICGVFLLPPGFVVIFQQRYGFVRAWSSAGSQPAVQVERSADQCKVRESLREVSQGLATMTGLFRIEAKMIGKAEHPLENQSRLLEPRPVVAAGSSQRLDQPKRADVEGAFLSK